MKLARCVRIRIHPDGKVEIETDGFVGPSCLDVTKTLATTLVGKDPGDDCIVTDKKPEFYLTEDEDRLFDENHER